MTHDPKLQPGMLLAALGQALPQPPQFLASTCVSDSQPFAGSLSQSPNQPVQADATHLPPRQTDMGELGSGPHWFPHAPQFLESLAESVSQPLARLASQSLKPWMQTPLHLPALQDGVALAPTMHGVAQLPQCATSL